MRKKCKQKVYRKQNILIVKLYSLYVFTNKKNFSSGIYKRLKCSSMFVCFKDLKVDRIVKSIMGLTCSCINCTAFQHFDHGLSNIILSEIGLQIWLTVVWMNSVFNPSLVSMLSVNFKILSLFFLMSEICCLLACQILELNLFLSLLCPNVK